MITIFLCGVSILILISLLVLVRLGRTRASSSRILTNGFLFFNLANTKRRLINIEEEQKFGSVVLQKLAKTMEFLPDLDS